MATDIKKQIKDKLEKVVVNVGVGKKAVSQSGFDSKILPEITKEPVSYTHLRAHET